MKKMSVQSPCAAISAVLLAWAVFSNSRYPAFARDLLLSRVSALPAACGDGCLLQMINRDVGWLKGRSTLWKTYNGGIHWQERQLPETKAAAEYIDVHFVAADRGWLFLPSERMLYETVDGGLSWTSRALPEFDGQLQAAWSLDTLHLNWVGGGVYRRSNSPDAPAFALRKYASGGWGILSPIVFSLNNNSRSWQERELPRCSWTVLDLRFWDKDHGFALGDSCFYSTDTGGRSWTLGVFRNVSRPTKTYPHEAKHPTVFFLDRSTGWMSLDDGSLYRTQDAGLNWLPIESSGAPYFDTIRFMSPRYGLGISKTPKMLYESVDGGGTWHIVETAFRPRALASVGEREGWIVSDAALYKFGAEW